MLWSGKRFILLSCLCCEQAREGRRDPFFTSESSIRELSEKILNGLLISQISKDDYADFHGFSLRFVSV